VPFRVLEKRGLSCLHFPLFSPPFFFPCSLSPTRRPSGTTGVLSDRKGFGLTSSPFSSFFFLSLPFSFPSMTCTKAFLECELMYVSFSFPLFPFSLFFPSVDQFGIKVEPLFIGNGGGSSPFFLFSLLSPPLPIRGEPQSGYTTPRLLEMCQGWVGRLQHIPLFFFLFPLPFSFSPSAGTMRRGIIDPPLKKKRCGITTPFFSFLFPFFLSPSSACGVSKKKRSHLLSRNTVQRVGARGLSSPFFLFFPFFPRRGT